MRTTDLSNPIDKIKYGITHIIKHDPKRAAAIGNYILTGMRLGNKGYYNSFTPNYIDYYTGIVRGNPRGTEVTAHQFAKLFRRNRNHFRDIIKDTGIKDIESKYFSRTLNESEFNAIKEAAKKYKSNSFEIENNTIKFRNNSDPLSEYNTYNEYINSINKQIKEVNLMPQRVSNGEVEVNSILTQGEDGYLRGIPIKERFGPNSDYIGDGTPLTYWYPDGRNAFRKGYDYAGSKWMVKVDNASKHQPFMHELHLHPSFYKAIKLNDPDVSVYRKLPFGIGLKIPKSWLYTKFSTDNKAIDLVTPLSLNKIIKQKYVAPYMFSKILNRSIKANPKEQILVSDSYFNSPDNWYRITNTPEIYGIKEVGKNVTTRDSGILIDVPSDNWRVSVLDQPLIRDKEGFLMLDPNRHKRFSLQVFQKSGSAHGNTSQASKGQIWQDGTSNSNMFPTVILEGEAARQVPMGITRTDFKLTPWEDIPMGQRIGFHTGEMPLDNLGYFQKLRNGKYSYQGTIIPDKRINVENY